MPLSSRQIPLRPAIPAIPAIPAAGRSPGLLLPLTASLLLLLSLLAGCNDDAPTPPLTGPDPGDSPLLLVPGSECGLCHTTHFAEWQGSMHAYAGTDPLWYAINDAGQEDTGGALGQFCIGCHVPAAQLAGLTGMPLEREVALREPLIGDGVGCGFCHSIDRFTGISNRQANFVLARDRTVYGTIGDPQPTPYHQTETRSGLANSAFCGTCHELENEAGLTIESTYSEWLTSSYTPRGVDCHDCHMPEYLGRATDSSPVRTLHRHTFVGVDVALEEFPGRDEQLAAVGELLRGAASLELGAAVEADSVRLRALVDNTRTGHDLPSGPTMERQLWIEIRVENASGDTLLVSGGLDRNGDLKDHRSLEPGADPQLSVFNSVLLDGDGGETRFMWRARQILSRRIPANATGEAAYRFPRPAASQGPLRVDARLLFRALPPYTLREQGLEDRLPYLPTFVVDQAELTIPLPPGGR